MRKKKDAIEWININSSVPQNNKDVLISYFITDQPYVNYISIGRRIILQNGKAKWNAELWNGTKNIYTEGDKCLYTVTHWMELPNGPELSK